MKQIYFCILLACLPLLSFPTVWYVDDASNTGDYYTPLSIAGNDANSGTSIQPFATVNFALSVASTFDTIAVDAGTFAQQVIVGKSIYIFGAGNGLTFFDNANKTAGGGTGFLIQKNIRFDLRSVQVSNYNRAVAHIDGAGGDSLRTYFDSVNISNNFSNGIHLASSAKLRYFKVNHSTFMNNDGSTITRAIFVIGHTCDSVFVLNSTFVDNTFVGIDFNTPNITTLTNGYVNVSNCLVQNGTAPAIAAAGFLGGSISSNTIMNVQFCGMEIKACQGSGNSTGPGSFIIKNNLITQSAPSIQRRDIAGIAVMNRDANIAGGSGTLSSQGMVLYENEIRDYRVLGVPVTNPPYPPAEVTNWSAVPYDGKVPDTLFDAIGILIEGSNHKIFRNKFVNCEIGLQVQQIPAFTGTVAPISDYFDANRVYTATPSQSIIAQKNAYFNCGISIRAVNMPSVIDAGSSYFGYTTVPTITNVVVTLIANPIAAFPAINPHFPKANPLKPTGNIDFSPWVINANDDAATGYQGNFTYLTVDQQSPLYSGLRYIQKGHDSVSGGPVLTVEISPGVYNERNVVSKNVHYLPVSNPTLNTLSMQGLNDTLYLEANLELKDSLICNNGVINTSSLSTILMKETCRSDVGTATSFVNGPIRAERFATGSFTLNLPVGKKAIGNRHIQLTMSQTNSLLTTYEGEYFPTGATILPANTPILPTWTPQSRWFVNDGGAGNFSNPQITLNYGANDYPAASAHTIAKRVTTPSPAWDYIKDLTPTFSATSGTVSSSVSQNAKFTRMGEFALAPITVCAITSFTAGNVCAGDTVRPVNTSSVALSTGTVFSYTWDFGDGSAQIVQNGTFAPLPSGNPVAPTHVYPGAGTYTIKLISVNDISCKDSVSLTVNVNPLPTGFVTPNGTQNICPGDSLLLNATASGNYTWAAVPSLSATSSNTLFAKAAGKYFILLSNNNGCRATSDTVTIGFTNCSTYLGISKAATSISKLNATDFEVTYRIKTINYGNSSMSDIVLTENLGATFPAPTAFTVTGNSVLNGSFIADPAFNGSSNTSLVSAPGNTLAGNDSSVIELKVVVRPSGQTQFRNIITATATYSAGTLRDTSVNGFNPDTDHNGIPTEFDYTVVDLISDLLIPGGFSPNADGVNDFFVIQGIEAYPDNEVQVFNRWGNVVYSKKQFNNSEPWSGAANVSGPGMPGDKVPIGTYFYVIKLNNTDQPLKGYITIKY